MNNAVSPPRDVASEEHDRLTPGDAFRGVYVLFSVLGLLLAAANFSRNFLESMQWLIALVDLYRGIAHPLAEAFFATVWPEQWAFPGKDFIDLFFMLFFIKSAQNAARLWTNWQHRRAMSWDLRVNYVFQQFWGPFYFSMAIFALHILINYAFSVQTSAAQVLFLFGLYYLTRCVVLGFEYALPRVIDSPYNWFRMRFRDIALPRRPLRDRVRDAILYLSLPILIELNNHADLALPLAERFTQSIEETIESAVSMGKTKR